MGLVIKCTHSTDEKHSRLADTQKEEKMLLKLRNGWESWQELAPWGLKLVVVTCILVTVFYPLAQTAEKSVAVSLFLATILVVAILYLFVEFVRKGFNI